jgi:hypothetical protein
MKFDEALETVMNESGIFTKTVALATSEQLKDTLTSAKIKNKYIRVNKVPKGKFNYVGVAPAAEKIYEIAVEGKKLYSNNTHLLKMMGLIKDYGSIG